VCDARLVFGHIAMHINYANRTLKSKLTANLFKCHI